MSSSDPNLALAEVRRLAQQPGSEAAISRQRSRGKLTARERLEYLIDRGSFQEIDLLARQRNAPPNGGPGPYTDGVVTGFGRVSGRTVCLYAQDFTVLGGTLGEVTARKIHKVMDLAKSLGVPIVGLNDGAGARIQEGVASLDGYGGIFRRNVACSGVVPQISVIMGPCAGGAVYSPAMTDFVFMVDGTSHMCITGPDVIKAVTGEEVTLEELGGAFTHASKSGVAHFVSENDTACLDQVRRLLSFLPSNNQTLPPTQSSSDSLGRTSDYLATLAIELQNDRHHRYDARRVITEIVDEGDFLEYSRSFGPNIICGFARLGGQSLGLVANQPAELGGMLDIDSVEKAARFVRTCDSFNLPLISIVDVAGFLPGLGQEHQGILRRGAKLLYAWCESGVGRIQLVIGKGFGGAYVSMNAKATGADLAFAWPSACLAVTDPEEAVDILHGPVIAAAARPSEERQRLLGEYLASEASAVRAAEAGFIDDVIEPAQTRSVLGKALAALVAKRPAQPRRKHGNPPL
jgi:acetyl-CoA carboxylase carboxyltransferase component